jgi:tetratricopeptide (TPR) repeat protein
MGHALFLQNRLAESIKYLRLAVAKAPDSAEAHAALANSLRVFGRAGEAFGAFARALELAPGNPDIQCKVASFLIEQGLPDDAERLYRMAAAQGEPRGVNGLAAVLERRGDFAAALELLEGHGPAAGFPAVSNRARLLWRLKRAAEAAALLEGLDPDQLSSLEALGYFHLLGDILHDLGRYDQAFEAYRRANLAHNIRYDRAAAEARFQGIIDRYSRASLAVWPRADRREPRPVFIVGAPRSGTSLLEQILSCHPEVHAAGELEALDRIVEKMDPASPASLNEGAEQYLAPLRKPAGNCRYVTDKMPHNFLHLGAVSQLFPGSPVIYCLRDPLDTGLSIFRRNFNAMHSYATDLAAIGHFLSEKERLMRHWRETLELPLLTVRYEELVADPETVLRGITDFLGLAWDPAVLRFHESSRLVITASYDQVRKPLYGSAVGCAAHYRQHLGPLLEGLAGEAGG